MALLDRGEADRLGEMALAGAGGPRKSASSCCVDEAAGGELEDERAVDLLVEVEVEGVERLVRVAEAGLLDAPREQAILPARQLVADERGEEVDRRQSLGLRLEEPRLEERRPCRRGGAGGGRGRVR